VLTPFFGHISLDVYLELMRCKSVGREVVTKFVEELPMKVDADEKTTRYSQVQER